MKFTHLVQINDPFNPLIDALSREQLWAGLQLRAREPMQFVIGLDRFELLSQSGDVLERELHFGHLTVRDQVTFTPLSKIRYDVQPAGEVPAATLVTTIEEPEPDQLFVRFEYDTKPVDGSPPVEPYYQQFMKEAYKEADIDAIRIIRRLAVEGKLGTAAP